MCHFLIKPPSPLHHLPAPKNRTVWFRPLKKPEAVEIERWMFDLIRPSLHRPKLKLIQVNNIAGRGPLIQEREENKHARRGLAPAFSSGKIKFWFLDQSKKAFEAI
ncbi:uncharacterized protein PgNI_02131 [Pyricularia grisea]|uniref:Uncharacterized protein n=1 Tax=Pyricularia grisea TaxID=148305 RepID=A0A6P8BJD9_PYRGI|nr:uncharacterized protein PgNI_02131 [Pyricularia grisea]TLD16794.1 hypothetical protein PgNI_02131 [Pyricularia grisea]